MISRTFKLCLNAGSGSAPYINVNQYDEGETWLFELYSENGERYIPSSGAIVGVKSDGHGIVNTGTVDSEGRVVITETQQMTASAGRAIYELSIDGLTHGTANFIVAVERKPTDDAVMSDSDLSLIQEAIDSAEVIVEVIGDGDPSEVIGEHVDAWLDNHPEATTTVLDGAITAPKLNQSLWDKLLVSEEASGNPASFDDGADDVPVSSLKVALEPVQLGSGDPSPTNIRPIVAANGINRLSVDSVSCGGDNTRTKTLNIETISAGTYTFSAKIDATIANNAGIQFLDANSANVGSVGITPNMTSVQASVTLTGDAVKAYFYIGTTDHNNGKYLNITNMQMGVVNAPYQPYQGIMVERTGKNVALLSDSAKLNSGNCTYVYSADNGITVTATGTYGRIAYTFPVTVGETYTVSLKAYQTGLDFHKIYIDYGTAWDSHYGRFDLTTTNTEYSVTFTASTNIVFIGFYATGSSGTSGTMTVTELQLEHGSEATAYEPYTGNSYPYSLGQNVYGGSVDLATGVLKVDRAINVLDGTQSMDDNGALSYGGKQVAYTPSPAKEMSIADGLLCDRFSNSVSSAVEGHIAGRTTNANLYFNMPASCTTLQLVKDWFAENPTQVVYPLANPTTVQLTPQEVKTLLGYNNISSTGTVDVIYHADTKLYVDKMTAVDNNIIAPTEADFVATRNYTVNDLVIVNDTLYKVTANIATGSAITPNSNVTQTTLSALIKALS